MLRRKLVATAAFMLLVHTTASSFGQRRPEIRITQVPIRDPGGPEKMATIAGTASGVDFSRHKVLLYVRTNQWYVQPYADSPYTKLDAKGKWSSDSHLGAEYAALLVTDSYTDAPATLSALPSLGGGVLAIDIKPGRTP